MTSSLITISEGLTESAANTFTSEKVDLQLNPLDNEVFVVYAVNIDSRPPDLERGLKTQTQASVSTTARTSVGSIANNNVLASQTIECINIDDTVSAFYEFSAGDTPSALLPYVGIIATNDFFINLEGSSNTNAKVTAVRVYGVRAKAESSIYAALVQSELLSA